jgi:lysophospholipase L1-like esterase
VSLIVQVHVHLVRGASAGNPPQRGATTLAYPGISPMKRALPLSVLLCGACCAVFGWSGCAGGARGAGGPGGPAVIADAGAETSTPRPVVDAKGEGPGPHDSGAATSDAGAAGSADLAGDIPVAPTPDAAASDSLATPDAGAGALSPVQFYGRWDFTSGTAITVYSGSHVTARFNGTGISARLDLSHSQGPVTTVTWQIDAGPWTNANVAATMPLATGLPAGMHDVVFMARGMEELFNRWNPPVVASLNFLGFEVQGGALIPTARPVRTKIEFVGDSLTEGVRIIPDNGGGDPWHTDGHLAYPCQTALALGAEWRQVGFGHQGLLQAGHGNVPVAADSFDWVYANVPRDGWVADMVVLNQGTNDRDASSTAFRPEFARYLGIIRKGYPQAKIAVLRTFGGYREADIAAEVAARVAAGDTNMFYVDTTGWLTAADYTEGLHPNLQGTAKIVPLLVAELRKRL